MARIAFIDCEASGLSDTSYAIEVGWVCDDGAEESYLVAPEPGWSHWDERPQDVHGIPRDGLMRSGRPGATVAQCMAVALSGFMVFSDAPDADQFWLLKLFRAANVAMPFRVCAIQELFAEAARPLLEEARNEKAATAKERDSALSHVLSRTEADSWVKAASEAPARIARWRMRDIWQQSG